MLEEPELDDPELLEPPDMFGQLCVPEDGGVADEPEGLGAVVGVGLLDVELEPELELAGADVDDDGVAAPEVREPMPSPNPSAPAPTPVARSTLLKRDFTPTSFFAGLLFWKALVESPRNHRTMSTWEAAGSPVWLW